jgi:hypothetical protein
MSVEMNKSIVQRFWDAFNRHDLDATDALGLLQQLGAIPAPGQAGR